MRQQAREVTQLQHTIDRTARLQEAHAAREEPQWHLIKIALEDRDTKWDDRYSNAVPCWVGIAHNTSKVLATARVGEAALTQEGSTEERNETARQDGQGLGASQHTGAMQCGEPKKRQLQQQAKPNPKAQLKQQPEQQHEF